jgi:hypothetical protein
LRTACTYYACAIYPESTRHKAVHNTSDAADGSIRRVVYGGTGSGCVGV